MGSSATRAQGRPHPVAPLRRSAVSAGSLPDTGGREAHWFTIDEFEEQPRRPISEPIITILRAADRGETVEPTAIWLPA